MGLLDFAYRALISEEAHMAEETLMPEETDVHCIPACMLSWSLAPAGQVCPAKRGRAGPAHNAHLCGTHPSHGQRRGVSAVFRALRPSTGQPTLTLSISATGA